MPSTSDPASSGGNVVVSNIYFEVVVYGVDRRNLLDYQQSIRNSFVTNWTSFYYLSGPIVPKGFNAIEPLPADTGANKVYQFNQEFQSVYNYEKN